MSNDDQFSMKEVPMWDLARGLPKEPKRAKQPKRFSPKRYARQVMKEAEDAKELDELAWATPLNTERQEQRLTYLEALDAERARLIASGVKDADIKVFSTKERRLLTIDQIDDQAILREMVIMRACTFTWTYRGIDSRPDCEELRRNRFKYADDGFTEPYVPRWYLIPSSGPCRVCGAPKCPQRWTRLYPKEYHQNVEIGSAAWWTKVADDKRITLTCLGRFLGLTPKQATKAGQQGRQVTDMQLKRVEMLPDWDYAESEEALLEWYRDTASGTKPLKYESGINGRRQDLERARRTLYKRHMRLFAYMIKAGVRAEDDLETRQRKIAEYRYAQETSRRRLLEQRYPRLWNRSRWFQEQFGTEKGYDAGGRFPPAPPEYAPYVLEPGALDKDAKGQLTRAASWALAKKKRKVRDLSAIAWGIEEDDLLTDAEFIRELEADAEEFAKDVDATAS